MQLMVAHNRLGMVDSIIAKLDRAAGEYDERLFIDKHRDTGQWALFIKLERPLEPYPVFLLGEPLPTPERFIEKLQTTDSQRRDIRADMNKANEAHMAEIDRKTQQEIGKAAEVIEYLSRAQGMRQGSTSRRKIVKS